MDHLVELVKALAWPVAAVWLGYVFRAEVRKLLGRVSSLKYKDMEASFEAELAKAEDSAKVIRPPDVTEDPEELSQKEQLFRIAAISPRAAVVEAWTLIETAAIKNGLSAGVTIQRTSPKLIVDYLNSTGKFSPESLGLIEKLRQIRNRATHMPDFAITQEEAERYLELAVRSTAVINAARS